jgi:hypothetical protein
LSCIRGFLSSSTCSSDSGSTSVPAQCTCRSIR